MVPMEKLVQQQQQCDMELMKTAMLKHEETFRQQVHDLHRLYRVQKQLMSDLTRRPSTPCRRSELNLVDEDIVSRQVAPPCRGSEDELELTLALGGGVNGGNSWRQRRWRKSSPSATDTDGYLLQTPSSSTDSNGVLHQRATACDLREGVVVAKQPQWLVRCLRMA